MYNFDRTKISIFLNFIAILLGFFLAINLSTILGQTGDWGILSSGLIAATIETLSRTVYGTKKNLILL
jgi:hypothetical protein